MVKDTLITKKHNMENNSTTDSKIQATLQILNEWEQTLHNTINNENNTDNEQLNTQIETIKEINKLLNKTLNNKHTITDEEFADYVMFYLCLSYKHNFNCIVI